MKKVDYKHVLLYLAAAALAGGIIYGLYKGELNYIEQARQRELDYHKNVNEKLSMMQKDITAGKLKDAMNLAISMKNFTMDDNQRRLRLELMGDVCLKQYSSGLLDPPTKSLYGDLADQFYKNARIFAKTPDQIKSIERKNVDILIDEKKWKQALKQIQESTFFLMSPEERWRANILEAKCLRQLKDYHKSLTILDEVARESENDDEATWAKALRMKADYLLDLYSNPDIFRAYREAYEEAHAGKGIEAKDMLARAKAIYAILSNNVSPVNQERPAADLGLLKIYVFEKQRTKAYKLANKILFSESSPLQKGQAMRELAELEDSMGRKPKAAEILERCLRQYPDPHQSPEVAMRLYELYYQMKDWDRALSTAKMIFKQYNEIRLISRILKDFFTGDDNLMTILVQSGLKDMYLKEIKSMLGGLRLSNQRDWSQIRDEVNYIYAQILYYIGNYNESEKMVMECVNTTGIAQDLLDRLYYLDLQCALKKKESPAMIICRASRYLNYFPQGVFYREVMSILMDQYYDAGMYDIALNTAKKIYVDEVAKTKNKQFFKDFNRDRWLKTVAKIGMCYEKLGFYDRSNRILRSYSDQLAKSPEAVEIFKCWANDAAKRGQTREAIRRLKVLADMLDSQGRKVELKVAQCLLQFKIDPEKAYLKSRNLLGEISMTKEIDNDRKRNLSKTLYESMLDYAFEKEPRKVDPLINQIVKEFPREAWTEYWILRSLTPLFGTAKLKTLSRKHEETLKKNFTNGRDRNTYNFISKQLELINALVAIEKSTKELKEERGL